MKARVFGGHLIALAAAAVSITASLPETHLRAGVGEPGAGLAAFGMVRVLKDHKLGASRPLSCRGRRAYRFPSRRGWRERSGTTGGRCCATGCPGFAQLLKAPGQALGDAEVVGAHAARDRRSVGRGSRPSCREDGDRGQLRRVDGRNDPGGLSCDVAPCSVFLVAPQAGKARRRRTDAGKGFSEVGNKGRWGWHAEVIEGIESELRSGSDGLRPRGAAMSRPSSSANRNCSARLSYSALSSDIFACVRSRLDASPEPSALARPA